MSSNFEKQVNESLENGINALINGLVKYGGMFFRGVFYGGKKLKNKYLPVGKSQPVALLWVVACREKLLFTF